ncbi:ABC transporter permease [Virgibacillus halophilus]|uniref:ABC transporter permease n=1 Tax=Tigheibacillus halophilus TaxID=361280 RepID=A0ABU5C8Z3_9BACI|nr:ABC transporter permease [Virgibacillus halophilus]
MLQGLSSSHAKKEFAVLMTLGMRKFQLNLMLFIENTIIALTAILAGIGIGALLVKLFMMVFAAVLGLEQALPFYFPATAIKWTFFLFLFMFEATTLVVVMTMRNKPILHLLRIQQASNRNPKFSFIISALSMLAIGYAYYLAYTASLISMMLRMFPILALVIPGTYFFFSQSLIALTSIVKRIPRIYFFGKNMLVFSDMAYKFRDNAKMLFFVTILSAVSFTSSGILYSVYNTVDQQLEDYMPQDFSMVSLKNKSDFHQSMKKVENELDENDIHFNAMYSTFIILRLDGGKQWDHIPVTAYAYSDFVRMARMQHKQHALPAMSNKGLLLWPAVLPAYPYKVPSTMELSSDHMKKSIPIAMAEDIYNSTPYAGYSIILPDNTFQKFKNQTAKKHIHEQYAIQLADWRKDVDTLTAIEKTVPSEHADVQSKGSVYLNMKNGTSYFFFFGVFISILFFFSCRFNPIFSHVSKY